jgi:hypothetical protein
MPIRRLDQAACPSRAPRPFHAKGARHDLVRDDEDRRGIVLARESAGPPGPADSSRASAAKRAARSVHSLADKGLDGWHRQRHRPPPCSASACFRPSRALFYWRSTSTRFREARSLGDKDHFFGVVRQQQIALTRNRHLGKPSDEMTIGSLPGHTIAACNRTSSSALRMRLRYNTMNLPRAILFDLDDTILVAFGPAQSQ